MRKKKMLAALLAGLITLSLAGCGANKTESTNRESANAESGITATVTDNASEPTAESSLPTDSEIKQDESTAEKEQAEGNAPADSDSKADTKKPAESNQQAKQTEAPKPAEEKPQTPAPAEKPETPAETPTANEVARKTAEKINALRQAQGSPAATVLPGLGKVAAYRAEQLVTNFSHESDPDACTVLKYGEYVDMSDCGMPEASYYRGYNAEAAAKGNWTGTADEIADKIANGFKNSAGHWRYVGSAEYTYMAVGITYKGGTWYCCVCVSSQNYGG